MPRPPSHAPIARVAAGYYRATADSGFLYVSAPVGSTVWVVHGQDLFPAQTHEDGTRLSPDVAGAMDPLFASTTADGRPCLAPARRAACSFSWSADPLADALDRGPRSFRRVSAERYLDTGDLAASLQPSGELTLTPGFGITGSLHSRGAVEPFRGVFIRVPESEKFPGATLYTALGKGVAWTESGAPTFALHHLSDHLVDLVVEVDPAGDPGLVLLVGYMFAEPFVPYPLPQDTRAIEALLRRTYEAP